MVRNWKRGRARFNASALKVEDQQWSVGSNPTASAKKELTAPIKGCMMYLPWRRDRLLLLE